VTYNIAGWNVGTLLSLLAVLPLQPLLADGRSAPQGDSNGVSPNVILITISSLRADHVGSLGYHRDTTPHFDAFARAGVLFTHAFASSGWTMPAHGSLFTSLHPSEHGATHISKSLKQDATTLAEVLKENGYCCAAFCGGPNLNREHGFAQGFDLYDDYSVPLLLESLQFGEGSATDINTCRTNGLINDAAIAWLTNNTQAPFFLFVHYYDNHWDYLPPPRFKELYDPNYKGPISGRGVAREPLFSNRPPDRDVEHLIALYDGEIRQTDEDLGDLLTALKGRGLCETSIIIILADHGEQFYEHGHTSHHGVHDELIHVPLALSIPGLPVAGRVIDRLVSQLDILPTVLYRLSIPAPGPVQGRSLLPLLTGDEASIRDHVFVEYTGGALPDVFATRSLTYKCCQTSEGRVFGYDLSKDPGEQTPIDPEHFPAELRTLQERLRR
jgi:arylsulfatase A-like enzyme